MLAEEGIYVDIPAYADNIYLPPILLPHDCLKAYTVVADLMLTLGGVPSNLNSSFLFGNPDSVHEAAAIFPKGFPVA